MGEGGCITDVPGIRLGHAQHEAGHTGCTVVLAERGAAAGVQEYFVEQDIGFHALTGVVVPIVPSACIFDRDVGKPRIYPDPAMGRRAAEAASKEKSPQGAVSAGIGALCGKVLGSEHAMRGGLGTASARLNGDIVVRALAVCNAQGDVIDLESGEIIAGCRDPEAGRFFDTESWLFRQERLGQRDFGMDTTLCVVATNATFSREAIPKIAMMAQDGIARATRPSHTLYDGDVVFALSTRHGKDSSEITIVGSLAAKLVAKAIVRGVKAANQIA